MLSGMPSRSLSTSHGPLIQSKLGLLPAVISPYVINAIGARQARRWFATAEIFDAAEALRIGLLHQVVPSEQLDAAVARGGCHLDFAFEGKCRECFAVPTDQHVCLLIVRK